MLILKIIVGFLVCIERFKNLYKECNFFIYNNCEIKIL